jgi:RNA polymerase sigma factor (sigma-70 family)
MRNYACPRIRELKAQMFYAGRDIRARYALNLEELLPELYTRRSYPYDYIFYRITGFRAVEADGSILGTILLADLSRLLDELSITLREPPAAVDGPVLSYGEISERCHVCERTLRRWRREGMPLRWFFYPDGRMGKGIRLSALRRFVRLHRGLARRGARFSRLSEDERRRAVDLATRMRYDGERAPKLWCERSLTRVSMKIAFMLGRSPETIRHFLRSQSIFAAPKLRLSGPVVRRIANLYRSGASVPELCRRYAKSRSAVYSAIRADKVAGILSKRLRFVRHADFGHADAERRVREKGVVASMPKIAVPDAGDPALGGGTDAYMAAVSHMPVLTAEQEWRLFKRYNYLKFRMARAQDVLRRKGYRAALVDAFERTSSEADATREQLIHFNLRLVASVARRHAGPLVTFADLMSAGAVVLMRAVETFDFSRGNKFSTYLTWALTKEFARRVPEENYRLATFITGEERLLDAPDGRVSREGAESEALAHLKHLVSKALVALNTLEREVIRARFGLAGPAGAGPKTLEEIGAGLGLTGERIRQIQKGALEKLRLTLGQDGVEAIPG